ncbi:hypothetical protein B0H13DRAFT_1675157, partial [Mycena leptocephala]
IHHIFVECRKFEGWHTEAGAEVATRTERKLQKWDRTAKSLGRMTDHSVLIPETIKRRKLSVHLASDWHTSSIRLAGRIFGSVQRTMAARMAGTIS